MLTQRLRALAALPVALGLAACGAGDDAGGGPVTIDFWGWAPGYEESVAAFNEAHPGITVKWTKTPSGAKGGYQQMLNATKAGNAPCLAQVGYESVPTFLVEGALADVAQYANADKGQFVDWTWQQVSFGGRVFGAPVDTAPLAMFYRKDVFDTFGLTVPKTWAEYQAVGERLTAASPQHYLTYIEADVYHFAGLAWQHGASWFATDEDRWRVDIAGKASTDVAQYWQGLLDRKLLKVIPSFDTAFYADLNSGAMATVIAPVWASALIEENAPQGSGHWQVAPIPQWTSGEFVGANSGGSATAMLKGCAHPEQAWEFAKWMSTDAGSVTNLIAKAGIYPAAKSGLDSPELAAPRPYFGDQPIFTVFKDAAAKTNTDWQWGPTMTQVNADFRDAVNAALTGDGSIVDALNAVQDTTVAQVKQKGLAVVG